MISYIGGKSKIGKWIVPYYLEDMETYVEPFSGMFWCFFNMDLEKYPNLKRVVYNDFNPLNYNLFQCVQNPAELQRAMDAITVQQVGVNNTPPEFREKFISFQAEIFGENFIVQPYDYVTAAKYVYVLSQVFSGSKPETSNFIDLKGKYRSKYLAFRDKLSKPAWVEHFTKITHVENLDFQQVIEKYDSPLNNVQGKFSLSYYDFELLHQWYPEDRFRWEKKEFAKAAAAKKGVKQNMAQELLIMNY